MDLSQTMMILVNDYLFLISGVERKIHVDANVFFFIEVFTSFASIIKGRFFGGKLFLPALPPPTSTQEKMFEPK